MLGLHLIDTTLAHNRQLTTLKAETSAGKEGNELLSCGLAGLKTVPPKQNLTVTQKHSQQPQKSFHAHQISFCSLNVFGCLFFSSVSCLYACTDSSISSLTSSLESSWHLLHSWLCSSYYKPATLSILKAQMNHIEYEIPTPLLWSRKINQANNP